MQFENRPPEEGINAQPEHLGREAIWLILGAIGGLVLLVVLADLGARWLAPQVPFSVELALAERLDGPESLATPAPEQAANRALQALADRLRAPLAMPPDITVQIRVDDSELVNAYATVGGRIVIHKGLLRRLRGEHELAALLAHEMAHVRHRHVAASLGRGLAIGLVLSVVSADVGGQAAGVLLDGAGGLLARGYGREQERQADDSAIQAAAALHGHVGGVIGLFDRLAEARDAHGDAGQVRRPKRCPDQPGPTGDQDEGKEPPDAVPTWLSTHPADADRSEAARRWAGDAGVPLSGAQPPLDPALLAWITSTDLACERTPQP